MRNKKLLFLLTLFIGLGTIIFTKTSCKKIDQNKPAVSTNDEKIIKFFQNEQAANSLTKRVIEEIKRKQKENPNSITAIIEKNGYPIWDKVVIKLPKINNAIGRTSNSNNDTTVLVPFTQNDQEVVSSYLEADINTTIQLTYYKDEDYKNYNYGILNSSLYNAEHYALEFMLLDRSTFGHNKFLIKDTNLFKQNIPNSSFNNKKLVLNFNKPSSNNIGGKTTSAAEDCEEDFEWCEWNEALNDYVGTGVWMTLYDPICLAQIGSGPGESGSGFGNGFGWNGGGYNGGIGNGSGGSGTNNNCHCFTDPNIGWIPDWDWDETTPYDNAGIDPADTAAYNAQCKIIRIWKNKIGNETGPAGNTRKGNFGEIASDTVLTKKGYKPLHAARIVDINRPTRNGIDGIFKKGNTYYIVEAKCPGNYNDLSSEPLDGKQMSDCWIKNCVTISAANQPVGNRIYKAVKKSDSPTDITAATTLATLIGSSNYIRLVASVQYNGTVTYQQVDANGNLIGVFNP
jgi:hypothetical protein